MYWWNTKLEIPPNHQNPGLCSKQKQLCPLAVQVYPPLMATLIARPKVAPNANSFPILIARERPLQPAPQITILSEMRSVCKLTCCLRSISAHRRHGLTLLPKKNAAFKPLNQANIYAKDQGWPELDTERENIPLVAAHSSNYRSQMKTFIIERIGYWGVHPHSGRAKEPKHE